MATIRSDAGLSGSSRQTIAIGTWARSKKAPVSAGGPAPRRGLRLDDRLGRGVLIGSNMEPGDRVARSTALVPHLPQLSRDIDPGSVAAARRRLFLAAPRRLSIE